MWGNFGFSRSIDLRLLKILEYIQNWHKNEITYWVSWIDANQVVMLKRNGWDKMMLGWLLLENW
jgi:hypothetical protein